MRQLAEYVMGAEKNYRTRCLFEAGIERHFICLARNDFEDPWVDEEPAMRLPLCRILNVMDGDGLIGCIVAHDSCHVLLERPPVHSTWLRLASRKSPILSMTAAEAMADESWQSDGNGIFKMFWLEKPKVTVLHVCNAYDNSITGIIREL